MKIVQICYLYAPAVGGVEYHVKNISENLVELGHEVVVCTSDYIDWNLKERVKEKAANINDVKIVRFRGMNMKGLFRFLVKSRVDLIHVHSFPSRHYTIAWVVAHVLRIPLVVTGHYSPNDVKNWNKRIFNYQYYWLRYSLKRIHKLICIINSEKIAFQEVFGIPKQRMEVIPNGIDFTEFNAVSEDDVVSFIQKNSLANKKIILSVGRLTFLKGADILVNAFAELAANNPNLVLVILGPADDLSYCRRLTQLIRARGIRSQVLFKGQVSERTEVLAALNACDLFVLPSRGEVFGIVLVEAMYCKKIVVASDSGGLPDVIENGRNGFLFKSEDVSELRNRIDTLLNCDEERLGSIREYAFRNVVQNYNWRDIVRKLNDVYLSLQQKTHIV